MRDFIANEISRFFNVNDEIKSLHSQTSEFKVHCHINIYTASAEDHNTKHMQGNKNLSTSSNIMIKTSRDSRHCGSINNQITLRNTQLSISIRDSLDEFYTLLRYKHSGDCLVMVYKRILTYRVL